MAIDLDKVKLLLEFEALQKRESLLREALEKAFNYIEASKSYAPLIESAKSTIKAALNAAKEANENNS